MSHQLLRDLTCQRRVDTTDGIDRGPFIALSLAICCQLFSSRSKLDFFVSACESGRGNWNPIGDFAIREVPLVEGLATLVYALNKTPFVATSGYFHASLPPSATGTSRAIRNDRILAKNNGCEISRVGPAFTTRRDHGVLFEIGD